MRIFNIGLGRLKIETLRILNMGLGATSISKQTSILDLAYLNIEGGGFNFETGGAEAAYLYKKTGFWAATTVNSWGRESPLTCGDVFGRKPRDFRTLFQASERRFWGPVGSPGQLLSHYQGVPLSHFWVVPLAHY